MHDLMFTKQGEVCVCAMCLLPWRLAVKKSHSFVSSDVSSLSLFLSLLFAPLPPCYRPPGFVFRHSSSQRPWPGFDAHHISHHMPFFLKHTHTHTHTFGSFCLVWSCWQSQEKECVCLCVCLCVCVWCWRHISRGQGESNLSGFILELITWSLKRDRSADRTRCVCVCVCVCIDICVCVCVCNSSNSTQPMDQISFPGFNVTDTSILCSTPQVSLTHTHTHIYTHTHTPYLLMFYHLLCST